MKNLFHTLSAKIFGLCFALFAVVLMCPAPVHAATAASVSGLWSSTSTWGGAAVPTSTVAVTINSGVTVTVDTNATVASLTFTAGAGSETVTINNGVTLTVIGAVTIPRSTANPQVNTMAVGAGTLNAGSISFSSAGTSVRHKLTISSGTVTVTGNVTQSGSGKSPGITFTGAGTLNLGGTFFNSTACTLTTFAGSTIVYNGSGAQTVGNFANFVNLTLAGSGVKSLQASTAVSNMLSIAPTGGATASIAAGQTLTVQNLMLGGLGQASGTWGSTASTATNTNNTYFAATTGKLSVTTSAVDTTAPTVTSVTASTANGTYKAGDTVSVQVNFSEPVLVTGSPRILLETGSTDEWATYASGSSGSTLVFTYTVQSGDTTSDLDYQSTSALSLNSDTIKDAAGNNAVLTLASPGATGSLGANKAIVIDTTGPTVTNVTASTANGTYKTGNTVSIQVTFSEAVAVTGIPQLTLETGSTDEVINYVSGNGGTTLTFTYTIKAGDNSADLDYLSTSALTLNSGTIKDTVGNNATLTLPTPGAAGSLSANKDIVVDTAAPRVISVTASTPDGTYKSGATILVQVVFSEPVTVVGTPRLTLATGSPVTTRVNYTSGSPSSTLLFTYTVGSNNATPDLEYASTGSLTLGDGGDEGGSASTIKDAVGNAAILTLPVPGAAGSLSANKDIRIDNSALSVSLSSTAPSQTSTTIPVTATFSKAVTGFVVGDISVTGGTAGSFVAVSTSVYTFVVTPSGQGSVSINVPVSSAQDAAGHGNSVSNTLNRSYDSIPPTVALTTLTTSPTLDSPITFTATLSESVTDFTVSDITATHATVGNFHKVSGTVYTFDVSPISNPIDNVDVYVSVAAGAIHDAANNPNPASDSGVPAYFEYDDHRPTVALTTTASDPANSAPISVTATFSEEVFDFTVEDVSTTNAVVSNFAGSGANYSFDVTPSGQGTVLVGIAASVAHDAVPNLNRASNILAFTYDSIAPTVVLSSSVTSPTNVSPIPVTAVFSEPVTGLSASTFSLTNGTAANLATDDNTTYTFDLTPNSEGAVRATIPVLSASDAAGNTNRSSNTLAATYDSVAPVLSELTPVPSSTRSFTPDVTVSSSEIGTITYSGSCSAAATTVSVGSNTITLNSLPNGTYEDCAIVVTDAAGNASAPLILTAFTINNSDPVVTALSPTSNATGVSASANLVMTFDKVISAGTGTILIRKSSDDSVVDNIDVTSGQVTGYGTNIITIDPSVTLSSQTSYYIQASSTAFVDPFGNTYAGISNKTTWTFTTQDTTPPTISGTSPTNGVSGVSVNPTLVINFSEPVNVGTGFITIKQGTNDAIIEEIDVTSGKVTGAGTSAITITPSSALTGQSVYYVQIGATAFTDVSGNAFAGISNTTAWRFTTVDTSNPYIVRFSPANFATGVSTSPSLVMTFDRNVTAQTGFVYMYKADGTEVAAYNVATGPVTGSGSPTITITPTSTLQSQTGYYLTADADSFIDTAVAENIFAGFSATTTWSFTTLDNTPPSLSSVALTSSNASSTLAKAGDTVTLSFTASETISSPTVTFRTGGAAVANTPTVTNTSGNNWVATYVTDAADTTGAVTYSISAYQDTSANSGSTVTSGSGVVVFDTTAPVISIATSTKTASTTITNTTIRVTDGRALAAASVSVSGSAAPSSLVCSQTSATQVDCTVHITATGSLLVDATDAAGNAATRVTEAGYLIDSVAPVIAISASTKSSNTTITNTTIRVTDDVGIASSTVRVSGSATPNALSCTQTSATRVDCTVHITTSGTLLVDATDGVGNDATQASEAGYAIDSVAPSILITAPTKSSNAIITNTTIRITDNAAIASSTVSVSGSSNPSALACTQTSGTQVDCTVHVTHSGTLLVDATDAAGNDASQTSETGYVVDATAPVISITAPTKTSSSTITNTTIEVTDDTGINRTSVEVGGSASPASLSCTQTNAKTVDCTVHITSSGDLTVNATDGLGNHAEETSETGYLLDQTAPVIAVSTSTKTSSTTITNTTIRVTDNDAIASSTVRVSGSATPSDLACIQTSGTQVDCTVNITSSGTLLVDATDAVGNDAVQASESGYVVETVAPVIVVNASTKVSSTAITNTTIQVTDNNAIASSTIRVSGTASPTSLVCTQTSGTQVDCTVTLTTSGSLLVDAIDAAGNAAEQISESGYVIDSVAPSIAITAPTKTSNTTITNTTIRVTDDLAIDASAVSVSGSASPTSLSCNQTDSATVDCTVHITTSGALLVDVTDEAGNAAEQVSESGYIVDAVAPSIAITAPTKTSNAAITDTSIHVTDGVAIDSSAVSVSGTASPSSLSCDQADARTVDCTVHLTASGTLLVDATDQAGNAAEQANEAGYVIDTVAPVIEIATTTKVSSTTITNTTIRVTDDVGISSSAVSVSGSASPSSLSCNQTDAQTVDCTVHITSTGTLLVDATDGAGNSAVQASETGYVIYSVAPVITITPSTKVSSSTITDTTIHVTDDLAILRSDVFVSGSASPTDLSCTQTDVSTVDCTVHITTSGTLLVDATDIASNAAEQTSETGYVIEAEAPVISVDASTKVSSTTIAQTSIQVTDNHAIASSAVSVSGSASPTSLECTQTSDTQVDCTVQVTESGTLLVDATDAAGNAAEQFTEAGYVIEAVAPVIAITTSTKVSSSTITNTTIRVTDNNAIASSTVRVSGSASPTTLVCTQTSGTRVDCTVHVTESGTLLVDATDAAGNTAEQVSETGYVINSTAPVIAITALTKTSSSTITNTTIHVTDDVSLLRSAVSVSGSASPAGLSCTQTDARTVDCTVRVTASGTLLVDALDEAGNTADQASESGYTVETTAPVISITASTKTSSSTITNTTIRVTDNNAIASSTVRVSGSASPTTLVCTQTSGTRVDCTVHVTESGTLLVDATDAAGNAAEQISEAGYVVDSATPVISALSATPGSTDATVQWTTSKLASSQVVYAPDMLYASSTEVADLSPRVTSHATTLTNLVPCATYHYLVSSIDAAGNAVTSTDQTFTTTGCAGNAEVQSQTSAAVTSSEGGTYTHSEGASTIDVSVPAGFTATSSSIVIQIKALDSSTVLTGIGRPSDSVNSAASVVFDVTALIDSTTVLDSFDAPVTMTYHYADSDVAGLNLSTLWMYHYHAGAWLRLDSCVVNTNARTITCSTPSFSTFAIFGQPQAAAPVVHSNGGGGGGGGGASGSSGTIPVYGCTDSRATNYNPRATNMSFLGQCVYPGATTTAPVVYAPVATSTPVVVSTPVVTPVNQLSCTATFNLKHPVKFGSKNDPNDVKLLEKYLNTYEGTSLPIDGIYSKAGFAAVVKWQEKYASEILTPWGLKKGTGYVFTTSLKKMNQIREKICAAQTLSKPASSQTFTRDLKVGSVGADVKQLQIFLNAHGFLVAKTGAGSPGKETTMYGAGLRKALVAFQEAHAVELVLSENLIHGSGGFTSTTRAFVNSLLSK